MKTLLRFEARIAFAALRRIGTHPSRRALWYVIGGLAAAAIGFDIVTSDVATRDLGTWTPSAVVVVAVAAALLVLAAAVGSRTPLTYGTRGADRIWWRYAGVENRAGQRATTAILTLRATLYVALGAAPVAGLLALAAPQRADTIVALAAVVIVLAAAAVVVSSACAPRAGLDGDGNRNVPRHRRRTAVPYDSGPSVAVRTSRTAIPHGIMAARWLVAVRRGDALVPYDRFAFGAVAGFVAPRFAALVGGQTVSMAIVVGGLALIFDVAIRGTTAPATLRSPWWRAAVGTSPLAIAAWAISDAAATAALLTAFALGLGIALGDALPSLAAVPAILLLPVTLRLMVLAVDTVFPAALDRRGVGAIVRIVVIGALTSAIWALALVAGAYGGVFASLATTTASMLAVVIVAPHWCAARLPAAVD